MKPPEVMQSPEAEEPRQVGFRANLAEAARFWEPRRITYNFILTVVVGTWLAATWPHFRNEMKLSSLMLLFVLAALANLCYSAAYLVDLSLSFCAGGTGWQLGRRGLWIAGTVIAIVLANYWIADEIYPYVK